MLESPVTSILKLSNIRKEFRSTSGNNPIVAIDNVSLSVEHGKTLGIVGESGSGKSTLGRVMLRLAEPTSGTIEFQGENLLKKNPREMRAIRSKIQMIFQDPMASLDPRMTVRELIREPLDIHKTGTTEERNRAVEKIAESVGISLDALEKYPHEFSGGQRQRISIARAVVNRPELIVADEPVSALDVSIQAQILNLLRSLKEELNLTFVFISHDLSVVRYFADEVAVMYLGNIVEYAPTEEIFSNPKHPYTQALISAVPHISTEEKRERIILSGDIPSPTDLPSGCHFHTRCPLATDQCCIETPRFELVAPSHYASCLLLKTSEKRS
ncbi:MAG: oligopeptide transporter, ATP-binding protein [Actinomycetota bacterium]|jgi:oligopeptide/dipeptide ABC transporter ATP-binding protein